MLLYLILWAGQLSRYSDRLRARRSGDRIPVGGDIFRTCPDRPWGPPSLLYNGYRFFPGGKERPGCDADPSPPYSAVDKKAQNYSSTPPMGRLACTESQCMYNGVLQLFSLIPIPLLSYYAITETAYAKSNVKKPCWLKPVMVRGTLSQSPTYSSNMICSLVNDKVLFYPVPNN